MGAGSLPGINLEMALLEMVLRMSKGSCWLRYACSVALAYVDRDKLFFIYQTLLSILKHRAIEKTVERCEFTVVEATDLYEQDEQDEDHDTLESRLIIRLHCKHGRHGNLCTCAVL